MNASLSASTSATRDPALFASQERPAATQSGFGMLAALLALPVVTIATIAWASAHDSHILLGTALWVGGLLVILTLAGFYMLQPNQSVTITLFGAYRGTDRTTGLRWVWPWLRRQKSRCAPTTWSPRSSR